MCAACGVCVRTRGCMDRSSDRFAALSILLPFFEHDKGCMEAFVSMPGAVKAIFTSLRLGVADQGDDAIGVCVCACACSSALWCCMSCLALSLFLCLHIVHTV